MVLADHYYLDCGRGNKYGGDSWCEPFKTWLYVYNFEPEDLTQDGSILGSEVAVWSEMITNSNVHSVIWTRAAALTDRLWSPKVEINPIDVSNR